MQMKRRGKMFVAYITDQELIPLKYKEHVSSDMKKSKQSIQEWTKIHISKWRIEDPNGWLKVGQDPRFH